MEAEPRRPSSPVRPLPETGRAPAWRSADILRAAALVLGLWLLIRLLWVAYPLLFLSFLGLLFGLAVARSADFLERLHVPRGFGAALTVLVFFGVLVGLGALVGPSLRKQFGELRTAVPQAVDQIGGWLDRHQGGLLGQVLPSFGKGGPPQPAAEGGGASPAGRLPGDLSGQLGALTRYLFSFLSSTVEVVVGTFLILFLSIYIGASPDLYRRGLLHLVPHRARPRAEEVLAAVATTLRRWLLSQFVAMVVIAVLLFIVLSLMKVRAALALAILAGLFEFIPTLGPILSGTPAVAMGFLDSPQKALYVLIAFVGIQFFENHLLIPMLMKKGLDLPPVVTLLGLAVMSLLFGFLGMLIAVPLLAAVMVVVKLLYVRDVIGDEVETALDA